MLVEVDNVETYFRVLPSDAMQTHRFSCSSGAVDQPASQVKVGSRYLVDFQLAIQCVALGLVQLVEERDHAFKIPSVLLGEQLQLLLSFSCGGWTPATAPKAIEAMSLGGGSARSSLSPPDCGPPGWFLLEEASGYKASFALIINSSTHCSKLRLIRSSSE